MNISQDIKDWIINEYINEKHKTYRRIMKDVYEKFDLQIQIEDYVEVLEEYRKKIKEKEIPKVKYKKYEFTDKDDEFIGDELKKGTSCQKIFKKMLDKGYDITYSNLRNRCKTIRHNEDVYNEICRQKELREIQKKEKLNSKKRKKVVLDEEEIFNLRQQGMSKSKIAKMMRVSPNRIQRVCKNIYEKKGINESSYNKKIDDIDFEKVYKLRKKGIARKQIATKFNVSEGTIAKVCKIIFEQKGEIEPKYITHKRNKNIDEEEVFKLREQGWTIRDISEKYNVGTATMHKICKKVYADKGKNRPKYNRGKNKKKLDKEIIFELREQKLSYREIAEELGETLQVIRNTCKKIYEEKGKEEPRYSKNNSNKKEILKLKKQGLSFKEIAEKIGISEKSALIVCKNIYKENGIEFHETKKEIKQKKIDFKNMDINKFNENLQKLKKTKNATDEQLEEISKACGKKIDDKNMEK